MRSSPSSTTNGWSPTCLSRHPDGVAETERLALADEVDVGEVGERLDLLQARRSCPVPRAPARVRCCDRSGPRDCRLPRPVMMRMSSIPARTASSTTYWMAGLSTTGSISFGCAFVDRKEPRAEPGSRDHRLANFHRSSPCHDLPRSLYESGGARYPWHSTVASASRPGVADAHVRISLQGLWRAPRGRAVLHRRRAHRVPRVRRQPAQGVRQHRHHVQGLRLLQDRQPEGRRPPPRSRRRATRGRPSRRRATRASSKVGRHVEVGGHVVVERGFVGRLRQVRLGGPAKTA